ncbi:hypothetical protein IAT38_001642 [Cryptococcus sp. DSM 104549]
MPIPVGSRCAYTGKFIVGGQCEGTGNFHDYACATHYNETEGGGQWHLKPLNAGRYWDALEEAEPTTDMSEEPDCHSRAQARARAETSAVVKGRSPPAGSGAPSSSASAPETTNCLACNRVVSPVSTAGIRSVKRDPYGSVIETKRSCDRRAAEWAGLTDPGTVWEHQPIAGYHDDPLEDDPVDDPSVHPDCVARDSDRYLLVHSR